MLELMSYGDGTILSDITLEIKPKQAYALLCATEEQRAALARAMCGAVNAQVGDIRFFDLPFGREALELRKKIRAVPYNLCIDGNMTVEEYLCFTADTLEIESDIAYRQISEAMELCLLEGVQKRIFKKLSKSERTRLFLAAALLGNPEYIVLDNPFDGIEGAERKELYEFFSMLAKIKALVLITPNPSEASRLCESMAVIANGKVAICGSIDEIESKINSTNELILSARGDAELIVGTLQALEGIVSARVCTSEANGVHTVSVEHTPDTSIKDKIFEALKKINIPMLSYRQIKLTLDDVYYSLTKDEVNKSERGGEKEKSKEGGRA